MGLDLVELVIEVEQKFDITISDKDAGEITTVGQLFEYVVAKTADRQPTCLSSVTFYRLRRALVEVTGISRNALRPRCELTPLLPESDRRRYWRRVAEVTRLQLPELKRPLWLTAVLTMLSLAIAGHTFWLGWPRFGFRVSTFIAIAAGAATAFAGCKISVPLAIEFDATSRTLGGLTTAVMTRNYAGLCANQHQGTPAEIWATLVALVSEQLGVDPDCVTPEARFVDDFGAD